MNYTLFKFSKECVDVRVAAFIPVSVIVNAYIAFILALSAVLGKRHAELSDLCRSIVLLVSHVVRYHGKSPPALGLNALCSLI